MSGLRLFLYKPRPARRPAQGSSTQVAAATGREFSHALLNAVMRKRDVELGSACNEAVKRQTTRFALEMPCDGHFLPWLTAPTLPVTVLMPLAGGRRRHHRGGPLLVSTTVTPSSTAARTAAVDLQSRLLVEPRTRQADFKSALKK